MKDAFSTRIPPSMINFREKVSIDDDSTTTTRSNKSTSESGSKDGAVKLPNILQNFDYNGIDDNMKRKSVDYNGLDNNLKSKDGDKNVPFNPFLYHIGQEQKISKPGSIAGDDQDKRMA